MGFEPGAAGWLAQTKPRSYGGHQLLFVRHTCEGKFNNNMSRSGGQVVNMITFYYDDPSLNPVEAYLQLFLQNLCLKRTNINRKEGGIAHFLKKNLLQYLSRLLFYFKK